jgi:cell division septum initiation protein DivIVA
MSLEEIGKLVGAAAAGFAASLAAMPQRMKKEIAEDESLALVRQRLDALQKEVTEVRDAVKRMEERVARSVSDEEFSAYTSQTSAAVTALTEKVGHATGAIEAWYRSQGSR